MKKGKSSVFGVPEREAGGTYGGDALEGLGKDSRVWVLTQHPEDGSDLWVPGAITLLGPDQCSVRLDDGQTLEVMKENVMPANPEVLEGVEDLTQLSYLNEPSILHDLDHRYKQDLVYTRAGPVLIAVNPFKKLTQAYAPEVAAGYRAGTSQDPHVFLVADKAFRAMMGNKVNQSMVISGESGAGKTETTKIAMQYLATLAGGGGMEHQVLQTNPILEAFGNAKTLRNNNSSRFGKLIDIHFDNCGRIIGAHIETYLLEKSRVTHQAEGERNYHVFYMMCAGASREEREQLALEKADKFAYLNRGSCIEIKGVDDAKDFVQMKDAMTAIGISPEDQHQVFRTLAAVLWLGNIEFTEAEPVQVVTGPALALAAKLLGVKQTDLKKALTTRTIATGKDHITKPLNMAQSCEGRDALAKAIYSALFDWLVERVNLSLADGRKSASQISILDIYGFESFKVNSFEQLCINYANERLQQLFNQHLFKLEQEEYTREGIDWTQVTFEDNQVCLDLIENRPAGILSILDEKCIVPKATDALLAEALIATLSTNPRFKREPKNPAVFHVNHYAGPVNYDTTGFLEKNKDVLQADLVQVLEGSKFDLLRDCGARLGGGESGAGGGGQNKKTQKQSVSQRFKGQLQQLVTRLGKTSPHFVRCIKPNSVLEPDNFDPILILQQLRCCGVLEVVRISRQGYPTRYPHAVFVERYTFLLPPELQQGKNDGVTQGCQVIVRHFGIPKEMFQMGKSKLFLRAGQIGQMEDLRSRYLRSAVAIQTAFRGYRVRIYFRRLRRAAIQSQAVYRGERARREYRILLRRHHASRRLGAYYRMVRARRSLKRARAAASRINMAARRHLLKRRLERRAEQKRLEEENRRKMEERAAKYEQKRQMAEKRRLEKLGMEKIISEKKSKEAEETARALESGKAASEEVQALHNQLEELRAQLKQEQMMRKKAEELARSGGGGGGGGLTVDGGGDPGLLEMLEEERSTARLCMDRLVEQEEAWGEQMSALLPILHEAREAAAGHSLQQVSTSALRHFTPVQPIKSSGGHTTRGGSPSVSESQSQKAGESQVGGGGSGTTPQTHSPSDSQQSKDQQSKDPAARLVHNLQGEFEHRSRVFEDDCEFIKEVKDGRSHADMDPDYELKNLRVRFESWKKDYKNRLRDTKGLLKQMDKMKHHKDHQAPAAHHQHKSKDQHPPDSEDDSEDDSGDDGHLPDSRNMIQSNKPHTSRTQSMVLQGSSAQNAAPLEADKEKKKKKGLGLTSIFKSKSSKVKD